VATRRRSDNHYDLDMNDIHPTIEWVSEKNPDQHQILISKTPPAINIRHSIYF
jgi:hypothetical protein